MTVFEVEGSPRLELPEEPVDLKRELRDTLLSGADWREGFRDDICIGLWLWGHWQPALEPFGLSREEFIDYAEHLATYGGTDRAPVVRQH